jgi:hypothetical protein
MAEIDNLFKCNPPTRLNPLEVYADAGRKAAIAINHGDWSCAKFHQNWFNRAMELESETWRKMARKAYDEAYTAARAI